MRDSLPRGVPCDGGPVERATRETSWMRDGCVGSVWNNGRGIPVVMHGTEKVYVPELIFGYLLTSSNYNDNEKKVTGGRNGYGAKLANIFSTEFIVETSDTASGRRFRQVYCNNMAERSQPEVRCAMARDCDAHGRPSMSQRIIVWPRVRVRARTDRGREG